MWRILNIRLKPKIKQVVLEKRQLRVTSWEAWLAITWRCIMWRVAGVGLFPIIPTLTHLYLPQDTSTAFKVTLENN